MAMLMMMRHGSYKNADAIENVIRYITRTRKNEDRRDELIAWGGMGIGYYASPELVIEQFHYVQDVFGISKGGRKLYHETLNITEKEFEWLGNDYGRIYQAAVKCAELYYMNGYQVVFAIHDAKKKHGLNKGVHIHFVVNAVNFMTGKKWHANMRESHSREISFNWNLREFMINLPDSFNPFADNFMV